MANVDYDALAFEMAQAVPSERLVRDPLRILAYATDASFYRLLPRIVVIVENEAEILAVMSLCRASKAPLTFRAAGTSLSGQALSDSVLIYLGEGFAEFGYDKTTQVVRLGPSIVGGDANRRLAPFGRKIGPDPASIDTAKIGGIAANNSSGMCCGVGQNSYHTLAAMRIVLADGAVLDTADADSVAAFRLSHSELLTGLTSIANDAITNESLATRIRNKFRLKNTVGYAINALIDFTDPIDILCHLMIGSEGTLGFLSRIDYHTVRDDAVKASAFVVFDDLNSACRAASALKTTPVAAVELLDYASLDSVKAKPGIPVNVDALSVGAAALLIEGRAPDRAKLDVILAQIGSALEPASTLNGVHFSDDPVECTQFWNIRKGVFPAVGGKRPPGTTVLIEDVAFPIERLAEATMDLRALLDVHGYDKAIIFGHALEGNLHFVFAQGFGVETEVRRYARLMEALVDLVVDKYNGSLKAEHGTGRNMAPFVEREWGVQATSLMRRAKALLDPQNLLNPGVVLSDDPQGHLKNLKPLPQVSPLVDRCIECGFCEPQCPSHGLTLTPRQRIATARDMARLTCDDPHAPQLAKMRDAYAYAGDETCAGCSLCSTVCPVEIDTGAFIRNLRAAKRTPVAKAVGAKIGRHFPAVLTGARLAFAGADRAHGLLGTKMMAAGAQFAHDRLGAPLWTPSFPRPAKNRPAPQGDGAPVLFFESCASRSMGPSRDDDSAPLLQVAARVFGRAGYALLTPDGVDELCCGQPFASKGLPETAAAKAQELATRLSREGKPVPVVFDTSPCASRMKSFSSPQFAPLDLVEFLMSHILPKLDIKPVQDPIALHIVCSIRKSRLAETVTKIARACAPHLIVPENVTCCGFAGDKGMESPELNAHALRHLRANLPDACTEGYSTSRTCEIGLATHSGRRYRSILHLVDQCSTP